MTKLALTFDQVYYDASALELARDNLTLETIDLWTTLIQTGEEVSTLDTATGIRSFRAGSRTYDWSYVCAPLATPVTHAADWSFRCAFRTWGYAATYSLWVGAYLSTSNQKHDILGSFLNGSAAMTSYCMPASTPARGGTSVKPTASNKPLTIYLTMSYDADGGAGYGLATYT